MATAALYSVSAQDLAGLAFNGPPPGLIPTPGSYIAYGDRTYANGETMVFGLPMAKGKPLVLSRFEQAKRDLSIGREHEKDRTKPAYYYTSVPVDDVIDKLGWWNPVACGRPKEFAFKLLLGMPSPASFKSYKWKVCGLTYFLPPIVGHSKSKSRTTVAGVALLKHWSKAFPKFKRFLDAFHDPKAEREITLDCIDFALGYIPGNFMRVIEANIRKEEERKQKEMLATMAKEEQAKMYYMAQAQMQKSADASAMAQMRANSGLLAGIDRSATATEMLLRQKVIEKQMSGTSIPTYFSTLLGGLK